jgi:hypothetical protein
MLLLILGVVRGRDAKDDYEGKDGSHWRADSREMLLSLKVLNI